MSGATASIVHFDDEPPQLVAPETVLGGKGAGLLEMTRQGLPVPPGFTIVLGCCVSYHEAGRRWPDDLEPSLREAMRRLEKKTGHFFGGESDRLLVSVRSGAAVSMPGMMDTVLDCGASDDPWDELRAAISAVFDSFHSARARAFRRRKGLESLEGTAVTIQEMFPSEVSGVLFTADPSSGSTERIVIESWHGVGEAVVSGDVTPDRYRVDGRDFSDVEIVAGDASRPPSLSPERVKELCEVARGVEKRREGPVDIEWAFAGDRLALLQVRSIRGLDVLRDVEVGRAEEVARLRALAGEQRRVWVVHNLSETLRFPTPLTWDVVRRFLRGSGGYGRLYSRLGYRPSRRVREQGFLELIAGRVYADPGRLAELFWDGMPFAYDLDDLAGDHSALDSAPTRFDAERADGRFLTTLPANLLGMWRASRATRRKRREVAQVFEERTLPRFLAWVEEARAVDLSSLSLERLVEELEARMYRVLDRFGADSLEPGFFAGVAFDSLSSRLSLVLGPERGAELSKTLVLGLDGDTTFEQGSLLWRVANGQDGRDEFLMRFGHRAAGEMELAQPRWREDPDALAPQIDSLRGAGGRTPQESHDAGVARYREALAGLPALLAENGGSSLREEIDRDLRDARRLLPYRESGKHWLMMGYELLRQVVEEIGSRFELGRDVYFLQLAELRDLDASRDRLLESIAGRRVRWESFQRLDVADVVDSTDLADLGRPRLVESTRAIQGTPVATGVATGVVRIVEDVALAEDLGSGYILVCPSTDPGWTPLFLNANALVVERGGALSHGAIVARDFGIPAVVCPDATRILVDGQTVRVDGASGRVDVVSEEPTDA